MREKEGEMEGGIDDREEEVVGRCNREVGREREGITEVCKNGRNDRGRSEVRSYKKKV